MFGFRTGRQRRRRAAAATAATSRTLAAAGERGAFCRRAITRLGLWRRRWAIGDLREGNEDVARDRAVRGIASCSQRNPLAELAREMGLFELYNVLAEELH